jgi:hypothetical protein
LGKQDAATSIRTLEQAIEQYDHGAALAELMSLLEVLDGSDDPLDPSQARGLMQKPRENRWFDLVEHAGDGFVRGGVEEIAVRWEYAQALLDGGRVAAARAMLLSLVEPTRGDTYEKAQVQGLLGRAHKQMFISASAPGVARNQETLRIAARYYYDTYQLDPTTNRWHGINTVALVALGNRHRVPLSGLPDAATLATEILASITRSEADGEADKWEYGTAIEACVALGRPGEALEWLGKYTKAADAFAFASTRRQLREVWGLRPDGEFGALLTILDSRVLEGRKGMATEITPQDRTALGAAVDDIEGTTLERVLGPAGVQSLKWYRLGLKRSEAVALISDDTRGVGSGFLIKGADLAESLPPDEVFVLTNAHVVSAEPMMDGTLYPEDARVSFQGLGLFDRHQVEPVWSSPPREFDATLLRLSPPAPSGATPMPVAKRLPPVDQRVYIIGHPLGGELSFSLQDNQLLDVRGKKLHYRAPTEPGSSGSAVFNADWKIVALHHAGSLEMPRLRPADDGTPTYPANEGISILAIKAALESSDLSPT